MILEGLATSFSQQAFTGAQYGGVAPTRNPRALPQGGVERQQRKPPQRDSPHMDTELMLLLFAIVVNAVVVVAVVVVAVFFDVLPAPSTILNYDRMSAATLVANSRSDPRCAPRALPQDDLGAGAPQCPRLPGSSPQGSSAFVECPPAPLPQDRPNGSQQQPPHPEPEGVPPVLVRTAAKNTRPKCFEQR